MDNWIHYTPSILNQGRTVREEPEFTEDFDDEEEQNKIKKKLVDKDPYMPRLVSIIEDKRKITR